MNKPLKQDPFEPFGHNLNTFCRGPQFERDFFFICFPIWLTWQLQFCVESKFKKKSVKLHAIKNCYVFCQFGQAVKEKIMFITGFLHHSIANILTPTVWPRGRISTTFEEIDKTMLHAKYQYFSSKAYASHKKKYFLSLDSPVGAPFGPRIHV